MLSKIILASKSKVRKDILDKNNIESIVEPSNVDEDIVKLSLIKENATPEIISGLAFCLSKDNFTICSSTFEGFTMLSMLFLSKISFLTLLLDARIILFSIV